MQSLFSHLRTKFIAGLFVVIPLGITIFILRFLFNIADGLLGLYLERLYSLVLHREFHFPGLGMLTGAVVRSVRGQIGPGLRVASYWRGFPWPCWRRSPTRPQGPARIDRLIRIGWLPARATTPRKVHCQ